MIERFIVSSNTEAAKTIGDVVAAAPLPAPELESVIALAAERDARLKQASPKIGSMLGRLLGTKKLT